jgi:hypothetical protein
VKHSSLMAFSATLAMTQISAFAAPTAAVSAPAPVAATYSAPSSSEAAPLAPITSTLLQGNPGAPVGIDDVLLVPHASAGQKAAAFEWADDDGNKTQAFVLWNKFFAAAQYTGPVNGDSAAKTIASLGIMTPAWGAGVSLAYRDSTYEATSGAKSTAKRALNQAKLFGSANVGGLDVYGSLLWANPTTNSYIDPATGSSYTYTESDSLVLTVGARKAPAAGVEGLAWNAILALGDKYYRSRSDDDKGHDIYMLGFEGQLGYVLVSDGITLLPGVDAYAIHYNGDGNFGDDYANVFGVSPNLSIILPLFEHWTLLGGARYRVEQTLVDDYAGKPSEFNDHGLITNTTGSFGLRYEHTRWAVEAQIGNQLLSTGTSTLFDSNAGKLFGSLALTVNLK